MKYRLWVIDAAGVPSSRYVIARTSEHALDQAHSLGLRLLSQPQPAQLSFLRQRQPRRFDSALFSQELLALLHAGLTLMESITALRDKADFDSRKVLETLHDDLQTGLSLSQSLRRQVAFSEFYVSLIRASESTSDLPVALERYGEYCRQMDDTRHKLVSALLYPTLLIAVAAGALLFLMFFVIPRFAGIYEGMQGELPWTAMLMIHWANWVNQSRLEIGLGVLVLVGLFGLIVSSAPARIWAMKQLGKLPLIGEEVRQYFLARWFRTLGMLLQGGLPLPRSMRMSINVLPSDMRIPCAHAIGEVEQGVRPSDALRAHALSTPVADQMLAVAERSGELGMMLIHIAEFHETRSNRKMERAMRIAEPLLMTIIGLVIGTVIVLMYLPIFELAGAVQ